MNTELIALVSAANPAAGVGALTQQLKAMGYAAADIQAAYNFVASTTTTTPDVIAYLQSENSKLQQTQQFERMLWIGAAVWLIWRATRNNR